MPCGLLVCMVPAAHGFTLCPHPLAQVGFCFFIALFFSPLLATVPPCEWSWVMSGLV